MGITARITLGQHCEEHKKNVLKVLVIREFFTKLLKIFFRGISHIYLVLHDKNYFMPVPLYHELKDKNKIFKFSHSFFTFFDIFHCNFLYIFILVLVLVFCIIFW